MSYSHCLSDLVDCNVLEDQVFFVKRGVFQIFALGSTLLVDAAGVVTARMGADRSAVGAINRPLRAGHRFARHLEFSIYTKE